MRRCRTDANERADQAEDSPADQVDDHPAPDAPLAEKVNYLFARVHPRGRSEYTLEEVAAGIRERRGVSITPAYLSQLRRGQRTNPSLNVLEALADFFGVNPNFFFNTEAADRIAAQLELYAAMRDTEVRQIALRAADLSPDSLRAIAEIIEHWRQLEGIPQGKREGRTPSTRPPEQTEEKGTGDSGPESAA